jgi:hypothetical protein
LHDVTTESTKAYFYKDAATADSNKHSAGKLVSGDSSKASSADETKADEIVGSDKTAKIKIDADVEKVLAQVKNKENKEALDEQLKKGSICFVILPDQIKIFKVLQKSDLVSEKKSNSANSLTELKQLKKTSFESGKLSAAVDVTEVKSDTRYVEISSIKISKTGVLENQRTKYDEKMSILNVGDRPLDLSTHLLIGDEDAPSEEGAATAKAKTKAK